MAQKKMCGFRIDAALFDSVRLASIELTWKRKQHITMTDVVSKALQEFLTKRKNAGTLS
jgi:hypothetical protein